jgi:hypothetical protein
MSDLFLKGSGYEGSPVAMATGLIAARPMRKVFWWREIYIDCAAGICKLLLGPLLVLLLALLLVFRVLWVLSDKSIHDLDDRFAL